MKILVTGGAGFIGYHLTNHLIEKGHDVTVADNLSRGSGIEGHNDIVWKFWNCSKYAKFKKVDLTKKHFRLGGDYDLIYHLAAINGTKNFYKKPYLTSKVNLLTLINMLDWAKRHSPDSTFIWTSSSEVYAGTPDIPIPTPEKVNLTVNDIHNPRFSYASSKIAGESMVLNHPINSIIVRPHNIIGPRMGYDHVIPEFITKIGRMKHGFTMGKFEIKNVDQTRAFCYIDDFIRGLDIVSKKGKINDIYNIGTEEEIKIIDLAYKLFDIAKFTPHKIKKIKGDEGSTDRRCPDITKIKKLGYKSVVSLDEGLKRIYESYTWMLGLKCLKSQL